MSKKILHALAAHALLLTLLLAGARPAHAIQDAHGHAHASHEQVRQSDAASQRRRSPKSRRRSARRAQVSYVCPMHPDMRSRSRGDCPKCGMALVAARRGAKPSGEGEAAGSNEGQSNP
jgi:hypothetical protein